MLATAPHLDRHRAVARIKAKRAFLVHLAIYVVVNTMIVLVWLATRVPGDGFWPIWPIALWGIGVLGQAWRAYGPNSRPISDAAIAREVRRGS